MWWRRKTLEAITLEAERDAASEEPKLGLTDLLCIGVGSTVGSGVFVLTGDVLPTAGPSAALSWLGAGAVCLLSALSYVELSGRVPTSGACYAYSLHALGELGAVIGAACLTLEYGVSGAGVARSWSSLVAELTGGGDWMFVWYTDARGEGDLYFDWPAGAIMALAVAVASSGLSVGRVVVNAFTAAKLALVLFFIVGGLSAWSADAFAFTRPFFPHGLGGTVRGASKLFFGFIGFDEVCCLSGRAARPERAMPRALLGTLLCATLISAAAQLALAAMVPAGGAAQWPEAFGARGWLWAKALASLGEVVLLPLVVLLSFLPQPELLAAMGKDGLAPGFFAARASGGAYLGGSLASGAVMVGAAACVPFSVLWDVISLGVLLSFNLTNTCLILVRYGHAGETSRPSVVRLVAALWCTAAPAALALWRGLAGPLLRAEPCAPWAAALGLVLLGAALCVLAALGARGVEAEEAPRGRHRRADDVGGGGAGFRAPGVPYVPGAAMVLNFMLMATMSLWDLLYLSLFLLLCAAGYAARRRGGLAAVGRHAGIAQRAEVLGRPGRYGQMSDESL